MAQKPIVAVIRAKAARSDIHRHASLLRRALVGSGRWARPTVRSRSQQLAKNKSHLTAAGIGIIRMTSASRTDRWRSRAAARDRPGGVTARRGFDALAMPIAGCLSNPSIVAAPLLGVGRAPVPSRAFGLVRA